ncbi:MAG: hypothetical protein PVSMB6_10270 [Steroidobacteraceae bacterium]
MPFARRTIRHPSFRRVAAFLCIAGASVPVACGQGMDMPGAFGAYDMSREASGTSWQPDSTPMAGIHEMTGAWLTMLHGYAEVVYDHQGGSRGDEQSFASGMLMVMARRQLTDGALGLRLMISADPAMGKSGYPLLFQTGETADGRAPLIDRQHPHNLLMEAAATYSRTVSADSSAFVYLGLAGEPALGPVAFMHRLSGEDNPEVPLTHHWLDSAHVSYGVVTAGYTWSQFKLETSAFNGREPDQYRYAVEVRPLQSYAARLSWNPGHDWSLQVSTARLAGPEQLQPQVNERRTIAAVSYNAPIGQWWQTTLAWGRKSSQGRNDDAYVSEASVRHAAWTVFGRGEMVDNRELIQGQDEPAYRVGKVSLGAVRDFKVAQHLSLGLGGLFAVNFVPKGLAPLYGGHNPTGAMGFVRMKLN